MASIVSIINHRGGVGKSTTTMMLAEGMAVFRGHRVLVMDFDPQAMVTAKLIGAEGLDLIEKRNTTLVEYLYELLAGVTLPLVEYPI